MSGIGKGFYLLFGVLAFVDEQCLIENENDKEQEV